MGQAAGRCRRPRRADAGEGVRRPDKVDLELSATTWRRVCTLVLDHDLFLNSKQMWQWGAAIADRAYERLQVGSVRSGKGKASVADYRRYLAVVRNGVSIPRHDVRTLAIWVSMLDRPADDYLDPRDTDVVEAEAARNREVVGRHGGWGLGALDRQAEGCAG